MWRALRRWPLLVIGGVMVGWGVRLVDQTDPGEATAILVTVGCVLLGAGLASVVRDDHDHDDRG